MPEPEVIATISIPPDWVGARTMQSGELVASKGDVEIYSFLFTGPRVNDRGIMAIGFPGGHWARCVAFGGGIVGTDTAGELTVDVREAIRYATPILHRFAVGTGL